MDVYYAICNNEDNEIVVAEKKFFDKCKHLQDSCSDEDYCFIYDAMKACGYTENMESVFSAGDREIDEKQMVAEFAEKGINMIRFPDEYYDFMCN